MDKNYQLGIKSHTDIASKGLKSTIQDLIRFIFFLKQQQKENKKLHKKKYSRNFPEYLEPLPREFAQENVDIFVILADGLDTSEVDSLNKKSEKLRSWFGNLQTCTRVNAKSKLSLRGRVIRFGREVPRALLLAVSA